MNTFIRVNGKLRRYDVNVSSHEKAIEIVGASIAAERFANPKTQHSIALVLIEGIGGA